MTLEDKRVYHTMGIFFVGKVIFGDLQTEYYEELMIELETNLIHKWTWTFNEDDRRSNYVFKLFPTIRSF